MFCSSPEPPLPSLTVESSPVVLFLFLPEPFAVVPSPAVVESPDDDLLLFAFDCVTRPSEPPPPSPPPPEIGGRAAPCFSPAAGGGALFVVKPPVIVGF